MQSEARMPRIMNTLFALSRSIVLSDKCNDDSRVSVRLSVKILMFVQLIKSQGFRTYAAIAPKLVACTVWANREFRRETRTMRTMIIKSLAALLCTSVSAMTGSNCTTHKHAATIPNSTFFTDDSAYTVKLPLLSNLVYHY